MFYLRLFLIIVTITMILVSIMYYNFANIERFKDIKELTIEFVKEDLDKLRKKVEEDNSYLKDNIDTNKTNIDRYHDDFTKFINKKDTISICSPNECSEINKINKDLNIKSDNILLSLRSKSGEYNIPNGFMFKQISFPNYFGEILEWTAFALMTWSLAGLSFMIWTMANLVPRAIAGHKWYKNTFDNYPKNRKAIFPFIL